MSCTPAENAPRWLCIAQPGFSTNSTQSGKEIDENKERERKSKLKAYQDARDAKKEALAGERAIKWQAKKKEIARAKHEASKKIQKKMKPVKTAEEKAEIRRRGIEDQGEAF
jgi:hypothetical protein